MKQDLTLHQSPNWHLPIQFPNYFSSANNNEQDW